MMTKHPARPWWWLWPWGWWPTQPWRPAVASIILLLLIAPVANAGGEVSLTKYFASQVASTPSNYGGAEWMVSVDLDWPVPFWEVATVTAGIDTIITDEFQGTGSGFNPSSVRYDIGVLIPLGEGFKLKFEHWCWHHVDAAVTDDSDTFNQQANSATLSYSW